MKASLLVRTASVLAFVHAVLHTIGGVFGRVAAGPATIAVTAMKANQFAAFGNQRTFWEFYTGLGLAITIFLVMDSIVLWLLAPLVMSYPKQIRPVLVAFAIGYLVFAVVSFRFFFLGPVVVEFLIMVCLIAAVATNPPVTTQQ